jgi:DNA polymerase I-like protein with 3'-5' exonuclease and polymerase domains
MTLGLFYNMQQNLMAKNLWLGVGMGEPFKFSEDYKKHVQITGEYRTQIVRAFKGLQRYWEKQKLLLERDGQIVAPDGYIRHLPHHGKGTPGYWKLINQAINFPVQHLASMVTGCAMIDCEQVLLAEYGWSYVEWQTQLRCNLGNPNRVPTLINEVHDELTWDIPVGSDEYIDIILETMARPPTLSKLIPDFDIKLKIEPSIADRWGDK